MDKSDEQAAAFKARVNAVIESLRQDLDLWVKRHSGPPLSPHPGDAGLSTKYYTEITAALLETAIDRQIRLLGVTDALDLITRCFERRAKQHRRGLQ